MSSKQKEIYFDYDFYQFFAVFCSNTSQIIFSAIYLCTTAVCLALMYLAENRVYVLYEDIVGPKHDMDLIYPVVLIPIISALFHAIYFSNKTGDSLSAARPLNSLRNIEFISTSVCIVLILMVLCQIKYLFTVLQGMGLVACHGLFRWMQDHKLYVFEIGNKPFFMAYVPYVFFWVIIIKAFYNGVSIYNSDIDEFVYAVVWVEFFLYILMGFSQLWFVVSVPKEQVSNTLYLKAYEGLYNITGLVYKFVFVLVCSIGIYNR